MKKLFGHNKQKNSKGGIPLSGEDQNVPTPIHQQHAVYLHQQHQQQLQQQQQALATPPPRSIRRTSSEDDQQYEFVSAQEEAQQRNQYQPGSAASRTSSFTSLPPGASPPIPSPNGVRSPSPYSTTSGVTSMAATSITAPLLTQTRDRDPQQLQHQQTVLRKKPPTTAPVALGILRALDPPRAEMLNHPIRTNSEERFSSHTSHSDSGHRDRDRDRDQGEKREKRSFWNRDKEKEKDKEKEREREREREYQREREREQREKEKGRDRVHERDRDRGREKDRREGDGQAELTRMIGFLTATASEDWGLVLEVCERASANENNAKEAVRALRREFKYGEPTAQLSAARLWAIMLRNSSELFISQSTARKFLDTLEDLLNSSRTSPVVRERVLDVIAAAAFASGSKKDTGFRGLWRRVKPIDKPDEGMPFDNDDAMFNPPVSGRLPIYDIPLVSYQEPSPLPADFVQPAPHPNPPRKRKSPTRNRIIPLEEDIRRLFQECKIGQGNASLLSQALIHSKPEDLQKKDVIKEFYMKCRASQELIFAQIPWASAGAEQSRVLKDQEGLAKKGAPGEESPVELTTEENLLAALLAANAELIEALQQYDDLERVAMERKAEDLSRKETRMDRRQLQQLEQDGTLLSNHGGGGGGSSSSSPSRSNSPLPPALTHHPHTEGNSLAPPPPAPHGPRSPAQINTHAYPRSRTPSPATPILDAHTMGSSGVTNFDLQNGITSLRIRHDYSRSTYDEGDSRSPVKPSAKALGKRKVIEDESPDQNFSDDDLYMEDKDTTFSVDDRPMSDDEDDADGWQHRPVQYVYDAAAERTQQRIREGHALVVNGVH